MSLSIWLHQFGENPCPRFPGHRSLLPRHTRHMLMLPRHTRMIHRKVLLLPRHNSLLNCACPSTEPHISAVGCQHCQANMAHVGQWASQGQILTLAFRSRSLNRICHMWASQGQVKARFWPWPPGKGLCTTSSCSLFPQKRKISPRCLAPHCPSKHGAPPPNSAIHLNPKP